MLTRLLFILIPLSCLLGVAAESSWAADSQPYKEYQRASTRQLLYTLTFDKNDLTVTLGSGDHAVIRRRPLSDVRVSRGRVMVDDQVLYENGAMTIAGERFPVSEISDVRISESDGTTEIKVYSLSQNETRPERMRRGNLISPNERIVVEETDFIRGVVLSVTGDIEVYGEVGGDVVSLFGDVFIASDAEVRGDIASITGKVEAARQASIYGEIHSRSDRRFGRTHRFRRRDNEFSIVGEMMYNRVDGFAPYFTARYENADSVLPYVWATGGYGFESERWRYNFGIEQTILRRPVFALGASAWRKLASDDDWIISDHENNAFAFLVTEDWKDYYEAEGADVYAKVRPFPALELTGGYRYEETKWLDAERDLWSLFGGDKKFPLDYGSVDSLTRAKGMAEIDTTVNGYLFATARLDTRDTEEPYNYPGWTADAMLERAAHNLESDFTYTRYRVSLARYQPLHRRITLVAKGTYGGSDGTLPMHKSFYLGGLGTLHGYKHKEYMGDRFWEGYVEYRVDFPRSGLASSLFWDGGQIANNSSLKDAELKNALGISFYLGDDVRLMLAKRLDRSHDDNPIFYARFTQAI